VKPGTGQFEIPRHLEGELPGGGDDQGPGTAVGDGFLRFVGAGLEPVQQGTPECQRFPGAGAGLADQVGAAEGQGNGECLDRERVDYPRVGERGGDLFADTEIGERLGGGCVVQGENLTVGRRLFGSGPEGSESAETNWTSLGGPQVEVSELRHGHDDPAALVVGQFEGRIVGERFIQGRGNLVGAARGAHLEFAGDVADSNPDVHGAYLSRVQPSQYANATVMLSRPPQEFAHATSDSASSTGFPLTCFAPSNTAARSSGELA